MQLSLPFQENPPRHPEVWEDLDEGQRAVIIDQLAQLIAKAGATATPQETPNE